MGLTQSLTLDLEPQILLRDSTALDWGLEPTGGQFPVRLGPFYTILTLQGEVMTPWPNGRSQGAWISPVCQSVALLSELPGLSLVPDL